MTQLPLKGKSVVNTRPAHQAQVFTHELEALGAEVIGLPAITLKSNVNDSCFRGAIDSLTTYDWVIFTSVNGVQAVLEVMKELGIAQDLLFKSRLAAIGPATRDALLEAGASSVLIPDSYVSEEVVPVLGELAGKKVLLPRADIARKAMVELLEREGALVTEVAAYRIESNTDVKVVEKLRSFPASFQPDFLTFTSSSTVRGFEKLVRSAGREDWLDNAALVAIGPITAKTIADIGHRAHYVATDYTTGGIIDVLLQGVEV